MKQLNTIRLTEHIFTIRFSFRRAQFQPGKMPDPLHPATLERRFGFFEMITLPSLKAQKNQDFKVVIIVDPLLNEAYRKRFNEVTRGLKEVYLHDYSPLFTQYSLEWLKPYINPDTRYLITTNLDADDGLYSGFSEYVKNYFNGLSGIGKHEPLHFLSCRNILQWDFFRTKKAPLGFVKPWTREKTITVFPGLTTFQKYPEVDFSVYGTSHMLIGNLFADDNNSPLSPKDRKHVEGLRQVIHDKLVNSQQGWKGRFDRQLNFHRINSSEIHLIVLNSLQNIRYLRIFEEIKFREPLVQNETLPGFGINYDLVRALIRNNKKTSRILMQLLIKVFFRNDPVNQKKDRIRLAKKVIRGFRQMS